MKNKKISARCGKISFFVTGMFFLFLPFVTLAQGWNPGTLMGYGLPGSSIYLIIHNALFWILSIFGMLAVIGFVIAGIMYILASGSEDAMKKAKNAMTYSIIGVVVALSGLVIIFAVDRALNASAF